MIEATPYTYATPATISGLSASSVTSTNFVLSWTAVANATSYVLWINGSVYGTVTSGGTITPTTSGGWNLNLYAYNLTNGLLATGTTTNFFRYFKFEVVNTADSGSSNFQGIQEIIIGYNSVKIDYTGATASDINNNGYSAEGPANAIDGATNKWTTMFYSYSHPALIVDFKTNKLVNSYTYITGGDSAPRDPISWIFYGSNDNAIWTKLDTRTITAPPSRSTQLPWYTF